MISQITTQLAIGTADDAIHANNKQFDSTLCVAIDLDFMDGFRWRHKVGLFDGIGNDPLTFLAAVLLLHSLIKQGKRVLLHCQEGTSRSVMVAAAYCAASGIAEFDDALGKIMSLRKVDIYRPVLYDMAKSILPQAKQIMTI